MSISKQEFTNAGRSMLGRAQNGEILTITKIVVGSGAATQASDLWPLTALVAQEVNVTISSKDDDGNGQLLVEGIFRSDAAPHAFDLHEVGVMAHIGVEADRLYSVANAFADPVDHIDPASPTFYGYKIKLIIDRIPATSLVISIGPTDAIQGENVGSGSVGPGWFKEAVANVMRFKRVAAGYNTEVVEDASGNFITVGMKVLKANLDLYVPASHPACPSPDVGFPTIQAAHDYLMQWSIPADKEATIHVYKGTFNSLVIGLDHPDARQINLVGEPRVDHPITGITWFDATHKKVTMSSVPLDMFVGQIVYLAGCASMWTGGCKVTAIAGSTVTLSILDRGGQPAYTTADTPALHPNMRLSFYPTVIVHTGGGGGGHAIRCNNGIGNIQFLTIDGSGNVVTPGACIHLSDGLVQDCMCFNAMRGIASGFYGSGAVNVGGECVMTECEQGVSTSVPTYLLAQTYINSCTIGVTAASVQLGAIGSAGQADAAIAHVNSCGSGVSIGFGQFTGGTIHFHRNTTGFVSASNAVIGLGNGAYPNYPTNNGIDLYAQGGGYIQYKISGGATPTCNPAANTTGNQNAYIYVLP